MSTVAAESHVVAERHEGYDVLERLVANRIAGLTTGPIFTTDVGEDKLWDIWMESLPDARRQHYNCSCCRHFIKRFGGLVAINAIGNQAVPLVWGGWALDQVPVFFEKFVARITEAVSSAKVDGVYLWDDKASVWGTPRSEPKDPKAPDWTHLSGRPSGKAFTHPLLTANQMMAEKKQDYIIMKAAIEEYPIDVVEQAVRYLKNDTLERSEKVLGPGEWYLELLRDLGDNKIQKIRDNRLWLAVATAPTGFCHVKNQVIATLFDSIKAGEPIETIKRKWSEKLHPLQYQRPSAAPTDGQIEAAEKLFEKLGLERSLKRRFATLADVQVKLWTPRSEVPEEKPKGGVFSHLRKEKRAELDKKELPNTDITWVKFEKTVLPDALEMEVWLNPSGNNLCGHLTAEDPDAPPILQWDGLEGHPRNPVSGYVYTAGSTPEKWHLRGGWNDVAALFDAPHTWQKPDFFTNQARGILFAIPGCTDELRELCLFPEILKSEVRAARRVIEAHSKRNPAVMSNWKEADANGLRFNKGTKVRVRVHTKLGPAVYTIDRWD